MREAGLVSVRSEGDRVGTRWTWDRAPNCVRWSWKDGPVDTTITFTLTACGENMTELRLQQTGFHGLSGQFTRLILGRGFAKQRTAGYGTGPKKSSEQFCWITPHAEHVTLGFYYGAELLDPEGILEGTGRLMRHVKIARPADLDDPALRALIEVATTHRVPPPGTSCLASARRRRRSGRTRGWWCRDR
jgi:hypothetical protein